MRMFSTMASISRSVSAMLVVGSVAICILDIVSVTNFFSPCSQKIGMQYLLVYGVKTNLIKR